MALEFKTTTEGAAVDTATGEVRTSGQPPVAFDDAKAQEWLKAALSSRQVATKEEVEKLVSAMLAVHRVDPMDTIITVKTAAEAAALYQAAGQHKKAAHFRNEKYEETMYQGVKNMASEPLTLTKAVMFVVGGYVVYIVGRAASKFVGDWLDNKFGFNLMGKNPVKFQVIEGEGGQDNREAM